MRNQICLLLILLFLSAFSFSCSQKHNMEEVKNRIVQHLNENNLHPSFVLLVPEVGCPGCISTAALFLTNFSDHPRLYTILTHIVSIKDFEIKTGINLDNTSKIFVDKEGKFTLKGPNNIYPCLFKLNEAGQIIEVTFQKPGNEIFSGLERTLSKSKK